eukprot:TRINITY_DN92173_c0_g1_i1.p1 TRINITY_DN92173_c0_g1~~TRINITY_DN92173_c0_g1_i1.p1  ORF type:complete len:167 (-),score=26.01 TRINITY_DN92173_c0_g1_i1:122-622(-)
MARQIQVQRNMLADNELANNAEFLLVGGVAVDDQWYGHIFYLELAAQCPHDQQMVPVARRAGVQPRPKAHAGRGQVRAYGADLLAFYAERANTLLAYLDRQQQAPAENALDSAKDLKRDAAPHAGPVQRAWPLGIQGTVQPDGYRYEAHTIMQRDGYFVTYFHCYL